MISAPRTCDSCGLLCDEPYRTRHAACPVPRLPDAFYVARERVRNMTVNGRKGSR